MITWMGIYWMIITGSNLQILGPREQLLPTPTVYFDHLLLWRIKLLTLNWKVILNSPNNCKIIIFLLCLHVYPQTKTASGTNSFCQHRIMCEQCVTVNSLKLLLFLFLKRSSAQRGVTPRNYRLKNGQQYQTEKYEIEMHKTLKKIKKIIKLPIKYSIACNLGECLSSLLLSDFQRSGIINWKIFSANNDKNLLTLEYLCLRQLVQFSLPWLGFLD